MLNTTGRGFIRGRVSSTPVRIRRAIAASFVAVLTMQMAAGILHAQVSVKIYNTCNRGPCSSATGSGAPYSGLVGSFGSPDIAFGTATNFNWHPFKQSAFGADITGFIAVPGNDIYAFSVTSDDGSKLFIDGSLVVDNSGLHIPTTVTGSWALGGGLHSFELQFFENGTLGSGVDLVLPCSLAYAYASGVYVKQIILPSTGLDGSGNLLRDQGFDARWTVDPAKGGSPVAAQVVKPINPDFFSGWLADGPNSQWIARSANTTSNGPAPYSFHLPFSSGGMLPSALSMRGVWTIDNQGTLDLNGGQISSLGNGQWGSLNPFLVAFGSGKFVAGNNSLSMTITSSDNNFEGARFEGCIAPPPVTALPQGLSFGTESVGHQSAAKTVTVTNNQTGAINVSHTISGTNATNFFVTSATCGTTLAALSNCTISIAFKPTASGGRTAILAVTDSPDSGSPHQIALSGTGQ